MKNQIRAVCGFTFVSAFVLATPLIATDHFVDVLDNSFSPSSLEIIVGDTVVWTNQDEDDDAHTATSNDGAWIGGLMIGFGDQFAYTFTDFGAYAYRDNFDGFTGSITVVPATPPPADITLSSFQIVGGKFEFQISGLTIGATNLVQTSTNLTDWIGVSTNVAEADSFSFTNTVNPAAISQFYRVIQLQ